jgi:predicted nucleic acid-binding protein
VVVADAGPLIALGRIGRLDLLRPILGEVLAPEAVLAECLVEPLRPGALAIVDAVARGWLHRTPDPRPEEPPFAVLGVGESAAIRLARAAAVPVLMDDRAGRSVARNLGVAVIGSGGVLLAAKQRGLIDAVAPVLEALRANGYHLSTALVRAILDRAGEAPEHL